MEFNVDLAAIIEAILRYGWPFAMAAAAFFSKNSADELSLVEQQ